MCEGRGGLFGAIVEVKYPFCDINRVGCPGLTQPGCGVGGITAGSDVCFYSQLTEVPTSPDVSIIIVHSFQIRGFLGDLFASILWTCACGVFV